MRIKKYLKKQGAAKKPCGSDTTDERSSRDGTSPRHSVRNADEIIDNDPTSASKSTRRPSPELSSSEIRHLRAEINRELARQRKKRVAKVTKRESKAAVQKSSKGRVLSRPPKSPPDALQKPKSAQVVFPTVLVPASLDQPPGRKLAGPKTVSSDIETRKQGNANNYVVHDGSSRPFEITGQPSPEHTTIQARR